MAGIIWHKGERSVIDAWLGGQTNYGTPVLVPTAGASWGIGLGTRVGGVGVNKADVMAQILEIGTSTANGYGRAPVTRDQTSTGWPAASKPGSDYQSSAPTVTFSFQDAPNPNGATLWFCAGSTVINQDNALFGADLAATRTFGNGDVERVTATYLQTS